MGTNYVVAKVKVRNVSSGNLHTLDNRRIIVVDSPTSTIVSKPKKMVTDRPSSLPRFKRSSDAPPVRVVNTVKKFINTSIIFISDDLEEFADIEDGVFVPELELKDDTYYCEVCENNFKSQEAILKHVFTHLKIPKKIEKQIKKELEWIG